MGKGAGQVIRAREGYRIHGNRGRYSKVLQKGTKVAGITKVLVHGLQGTEPNV